jgi:adenylate cyclase
MYPASRRPPALAEALEHERKFEWGRAAELYSGFLSGKQLDSDDAYFAAMLLGRSYEKAAFQSLTAPEFERLIEAGTEAYRSVESGVSFEASATRHMAAKARRLRLQSILSVEHEERVLLLDDAIGVERIVLQKLEPSAGEEFFEEAGFLLQLIYERTLLHGDEHVVPLLVEGLDLVERLAATKRLPADANVAAQLQVNRVNLALSAYFAIEGWSKDQGRVTRMAEEAEGMAVRVTEPSILTRLHSTLATVGALFGGSEGPRLQEHLDLALSEAQKTDDGSEVGVALSGLIFTTRWKLVAEKREEAARELFETAKLYFEEGKRRLGHLSDPVSRYFLLNLYGDDVQSHFVFATNFITDLALRRSAIEEGISIFCEANQLAEGEMNDNLPYLWYAGAEALQQLALIDETAEGRKALLNEAVELDRRATVMTLKTSPHFIWNVSIQMLSEATVRSLLAKDTADQRERAEILRSAADEFREGFAKIPDIGLPLTEGQSLRLGGCAFSFARVLDDLHGLSGETKPLEEETGVLDEATKYFDKIGRPTRVAEALWLKARVKDQLGRPQEAAREYRRASEEYGRAVSESPKLREIYEELSKYMLAWQQIEQARFYHSDGRYSSAAQAYKEAATILSKLPRLSPLGLHYSACSSLEEGEELSRTEEPELAAKFFDSAARGFGDAISALAGWSERLSSSDERTDARGWLALSGSRQKYSQAMAHLEEAKLLDRKGERSGSALGFALAAEILNQLAKEGAEGENKGETATLALLCRAWHLLKQADVQDRPEKYSEAAKLFEEVSRSGADQKLVAMARANAAFCHALEAGTGLRANGDPALFKTTKRYLEAATDYYNEAGMERAACWTEATERTFDGLVYLSEAEGELETNEKARLYALAESSFESAVGLFGKAGYIGKQREAEHHLEQVKQRKGVFSSPAEALDSGVVLQMPQRAPSLSRDQSVGYEQFEHANIQCNMTLSQVEVTAGEEVELELEMVNAGNAPALMVKVDGFPPSLEVECISPGVAWDADHLVFKARKIEPMATEEIRPKLRAKEAGELEISPNFLYLDEGGKYRSYRPEAVGLRVTGGAPRPEKRGLSAIMFTDIVGYTALTQKNEALALELLREHEEQIRAILPGFNGREVKTIGDSFLLEFASALEATSCAVEVQKAAFERNRAAKSGRKLEIRIGIHVGDVVHRGNDVLGDIVNIASRIQPIAEAGGICVSQQVYDQVWNKMECKFVELGKKELKNVQTPIGVYKIVLPWEG